MPRSNPLILKPNGKHTLMFVQQGKHKLRWKLIVTDQEGRNRGKKFHSYRQAKQVLEELKGKHPDNEYTIVSCIVAYGPPRTMVTDDQLEEMNLRGKYWCPYCRKFREFDYDPTIEEDRCPICRTRLFEWATIRNNPVLAKQFWGGANVS